MNNEKLFVTYSEFGAKGDGVTDDFVPCWMSEVNYDLCASVQKKLVKIEGAGHGLSYVIDEETYLKSMRDFFKI